MDFKNKGENKKNVVAWNIDLSSFFVAFTHEYFFIH